MHASKRDDTKVQSSTFGRASLLLITSLLLLGLVSTQPTQVAFHSSEVNFTDTSRGGFAIVPASCPSAPPPTSGDGGGYIISPGMRRVEINRHGYLYCVTNHNSYPLFVPANTASELSTFLSAGPGISGVEAIPSSALPWYCWYGYGGVYLYLGGCY